MKQPTYKKIMDHPDKDEIISKLIIGISITDVSDWLKSKYSAASEKKFVIAAKTLTSFKDTYLDFYNDMLKDLNKIKSSPTVSAQEEIELSVKGNSAYKDALVKIANKELDIETMLARMALNVETRVSQIYDIMQDNPNDINTRVERLLIEYINALGGLLDKYYTWKEAKQPDQIIQHNVTLQVVDQHISVFHDVIKDVLSQMDLETSMYFMEVFNEKMSKLKQPSPDALPSQDARFAEVKLLNENINQKINLQ
jgi:hypothetical protein